MLHRHSVRLHILSFLLAVVVVLSGGLIPVRGQQPSAVPAYVPNELLVRFRSDASRAQRDGAVDTIASATLQRFDTVGIHHTRLRSGMSIDTAIAVLANDPDVLDVQPNYIRHTTAPAPPNDPYWLSDNMWGLLRIQASAVWNSFTQGNPGAVIADIDTGVNYTHPDLAANMWRNPGEIAGNGVDDDRNGYVDDVYGIDASNHDSDPMDDNGHGTHTAGTIAASGNNGIGVVGVNWNAKILACKFLNAAGNGSDSGAIECFNYVVGLKNRGINIRVTNNSWGSLRSGPLPQALKGAVDAAGAAGILNVFAAGNDNANSDVTPFDPASFTSASILSVAASDTADAKAGFSNYGKTTVDLAAPGVGIWSTYGNTYAQFNGTSMAAPHAAGAAALLFAQQPGLSAADVKALLINNVDVLPQWSALVAAGGRLNVYKAALASAPNMSPSVSLTAPVSGATYTAPATVPVAAAASDPDGTIARVDFLVNGVVAASDSTVPYAATLTGVAAGTYAITALATDNLGATATSDSRTITVTPQAPSGNGGSATFVRVDAATRGTWKSAYGADGYLVVGDTSSLPAYAAVTPRGQSAWTWSASTSDGRALQKADGDRVMACWFGSAFTIDLNVTGTQPRQVALYSADYDDFGRQQRFDLVDGTTGALLDSRTMSSFAGGQYLVWNIQGSVKVQVTLVSGLNAVVSGVFFGPAPEPTGAGGSAAFVKTDISTQGSWRSAYGAEGYAVAADATSLPAYAQLTLTSNDSWTWLASTGDSRALQRAGGDRVMACWFGDLFAIDLNVSGTTPRQVALYSADYDNYGREQRFDLLDGATGAVLDSRTISNFSGGVYVVWNVLGHVRVQVTRLGGINAVVSGVFFGPGATGGAASAAFVKTDVTTLGGWKGTYGTGGYAVAADAVSLPSYAQLALSGNDTWTWQASSTDSRALQRAGSGQVMACWFGDAFTIDLTVSGTTAREVALYSADYDNFGRGQRFDVIDAATGAVLDSRTIANFSGGQYVVWNVRGHVTVRVTRVGGLNAVVSGVFFK